MFCDHRADDNLIERLPINIIGSSFTIHKNIVSIDYHFAKIGAFNWANISPNGLVGAMTITCKAVVLFFCEATLNVGVLHKDKVVLLFVYMSWYRQLYLIP